MILKIGSAAAVALLRQHSNDDGMEALTGDTFRAAGRIDPLDMWITAEG